MGSGVVNQTTRYTAGTTANNRAGTTGDQIVSEYGPRYALAGGSGEIFSASSQTAGTANSVALTTTYTGGFVLINPAGSGKQAEVIFASQTQSIAATVAGPTALIGGGSSAGVTAGTTAIAVSLWGTTRLDSNALTNSSVMVLSVNATLVGTPRYVAWLASVSTGAANLAMLQPAVIAEFAGSIVVGPGGYLAFGALLAVATAPMCTFIWREQAIQA